MKTVKAIDERIQITLKQLMRLKHDAHGFSFLSNQPLKSKLMGRKRSTIRGRGLDFSELRDYRPGDDIRNVDWRVTNRMGKPYVRLYCEEKDRPVMIIVDQRSNMHFGSQWKMKSVLAAELSALIAWKALDEGDSVGFIILSDQRYIECEPTRSHTKFQQYLALIVKFNQIINSNSAQTNKPISMAGLLKKAEKFITHDYLLIVISDFIDPQASIIPSLAKLTQHNDIIACYVYDQLEHDIRPLENLVLGDGEYQLQLSANKKGLTEKFNHYTEQKLSNMQTTFAKHNIPLLSFSTEFNVAGQVRKHLGAA
ncbi:MAG: hypothetical protein ACJAWQ_000658 [Paraglaciecola sp.]|jgi:uncharacterized protein (DUF58 family)|tara:strand:- start:9482 stop:10414 length:933 start_codon:yes stop_codon:yes gene_type:complete